MRVWIAGAVSLIKLGFEDYSEIGVGCLVRITPGE